VLPVREGDREDANAADPEADLLPLLVHELAAMKRAPPEGVPLPEVRFREDLGFDSLDRLEFIARVEQRFRLPLADDEVEGLVTLGQVARLVAARGVSPAEDAAGRAAEGR
jgi:acyl carrier protein